MLRDYIYINEKCINEIVEHIPMQKNPPKTYKRKLLVNLGFSPKVEISEESSNRDLNTHEKIELLTSFLTKNDLLGFERPINMNDTYINLEKKYVFESMYATKVTFPTISFAELPGTIGFSLWISNPSQFEHNGSNNKVNEGTFLYIPEIWFDDERYSSVFSGCSALQAVVNFLENRFITSQRFHGIEQLGRYSNDHPIDKLLKLGAQKKYTKKITCLYKKRYITDEQCFIFNGKNTRVHDLLGYPLFISE